MSVEAERVAARHELAPEGLSPPAREELAWWLSQAAARALRELPGVDRVDLELTVASELVSVAMTSAGASVQEEPISSSPDGFREAVSGRAPSGSDGAYGAPPAGLLVVPLLVRGVVPGLLVLHRSSDAVVERERLPGLTQAIELMLSSPVLVAQAAGNAQWLVKAKEAWRRNS